MIQQKSNAGIKLLLAVSLSGISANSNALKIDYGAGVAIEYTDNARRSSANEKDEFVTIGFLGGSLNESTRSLKLGLDTSLSYETYENNTFGDQTYFKLGAVGSWDIISNYLTWHVRDLFAQQRIDAAGTNIPSNLTDTNSFSTGPSLTIPLSQRQTLNLTARYANLRFDKLSADSQRYTAAAGWSYDLSQQTLIGLNSSYSRVAFDDSQLNPDYTRAVVGAFISGQRARTSYDLRVGFDNFDRDRFEDQSGFRLSADVSIDLTSISSLTAVLATSLQDSNSGLLDSQTSTTQGNLNNQQISGDVSRNNIFRLTYNRKGTTLGAFIWSELRDVDYKEAAIDRDSREIGAGMKYQMSSLVTTRATVSYLDTDLEAQNTKLQEVNLDGDISYKLSRKLTTQLGLFVRNRDSNISSGEFDEFGGLVSLVYGTGTVPSARRAYPGTAGR